MELLVLTDTQLFPMELPSGATPPTRIGPTLAQNIAFGPSVPGSPWFYSPQNHRSAPPPQEGRIGPTLHSVFREGPSDPGTPWFRPPPIRVAASVPQPTWHYRKPVFEGPAFPGAPWLSTDTIRYGAPPAPAAVTPIYPPPGFVAGPAIPGSPWGLLAMLTTVPNLRPHPATPLPVFPPSSVAAVRTKNYLGRLPDEDSRTRRFSEKLESIINSLMRRGILVQNGINDWTINVANATTGSGVTGTFP